MIHSQAMKTLRIVLLVTIAVITISGLSLFLIGYFRPKPAGIKVDASPAASVYINGQFLGKTPFVKNDLKSDEITLKLVPLISDQNLLPFETKISLGSGIQTVVRREFGSSEENSSGDIISFEKESGSTTGLVVISTPDNAQVTIDGVPKGFAPYKTEAIAPASHQITVKAPGYADRIMTISTKQGYRLTLFAKLAQTSSAADTESPSPTPVPKTTAYVLIEDTPTGFLRVRTEPGTAGEEIAEVKPGEKYPYLQTDQATGWLKIQYQEPAPGLPDGITGWVSNQYAKEVGSSDIQSATPSGTPLSI